MRINISYFVLAVAFILAGCQEGNIPEPEQAGGKTLKAYIGDPKTKTHMGPLSDGVYKTLWSEGDEIYVVSGNEEAVYTLSSGAGTTEGLFVGKGDMKECRAYYPAENVSRIVDNGYLRVYAVFPDRQNYVKDSFEQGIYPMVAKGEDGVLRFHNIFSVVQLNLTGTRRVDSLVFSRAFSGPASIAGSFIVGLGDDRLGNIVGNFNGDVENTYAITIDCGEGVQLKEDEATSFHVVIPPGNYGGFELAIYTPDGVMKKSTTNDFSLEASQLRAVRPFRVQFETDPDYEEERVEFEKEEYYVRCTGGYVEVPVQSNVKFNVSMYGTDDCKWIKYLGTKAMQPDTLQFYVEPSETPHYRYAYVALKHSDNSQVFEIVQEGYEEPYVKWSDSEIKISPEGSTVKVKATTNGDGLEFEVDSDWIDAIVVEEVVMPPGSPTSYMLSKTLNISAGLNDTRAPRSGHVVVSAAGLTDTLYVSQEPGVHGKIEIEIPEAGTLENIVKGEDIEMYAEVKVIGPMNKDDIYYLDDFLDNMVILDLSEVAFEGNVLSGDFRDLPSLRELYLPPELTSIKSSAFENCISLEKVDWGEDPQLTTIGTGIHEDSIFDGVWKYGGPFAGCTSLKTIVIPPKVNVLQAGAFYKSGLEEVIFAEGSQMVAFEATVRYARPPLGAVKPGAETAFPVYFGMFMGCEHLEEIEFPENLQMISSSAFKNWTGLKRMVIPESVKYILTDNLFSGCRNLESVTLPSSVTQIGDNMFAGCVNLKEYNFKGGYTEIGAGAFANCSSLESFDLSTVDSVGDDAFNGCTGISSFEFGHLEHVGRSAFANTGVVKVRIPDNMEEVPSGLFSNCKNLVEIDLNKAVILNASFNYCPGLVSVVLPPSVREVNGTFWSCEGLKSLKIECDSVVFDCAMEPTLEEIIIGKDVISATSSRDGGLFLGGVFNDFNNFIFEEGSKLEEFGLAGNLPYLTEIDLPESVRILSEYAFSGSGITDITGLISGIEEIGACAFYNTSAVSVEFPEGLRSIGNWAFAECDNLMTIDLPSTLESIGSYAFESNPRLVEPVINGGNLSLGRDIFRNCPFVDEVKISKNVLSLEGDYAFSSGKVSFEEGSLCTSVERRLFTYCDEVSLPHGLQVIGYEAFRGNKIITGLEIPETVTTIGASAFYDCKNIMELRLPASITSVGSAAFGNCGAEGSRLIICFKRIEDDTNVFSTHNFSYIELGPDVEFIGQRLRAEAIYCKGAVPPEFGSKGKIDAKAIYVPALYYQDYCREWSKYADIVMLEDGTKPE